MDAVDYLKKSRRMCKSSGGCDTCVAYIDGGCCIDFGTKSGKEKETVAIVEQWAKDHPAKTRQSEFLKMFPNAQMVNIERTFCVAHFDSTKVCKESNPSNEKCIDCRYRFWNEEVPDND